MSKIPLNLTMILAFIGVAAAADEPNVLTVVVGDGPNSGIYEAPSNEVICLRMKGRDTFAATWKGFQKPKPKLMEEAGVEVANAGSDKSRLAHARISFFGADGKPVVYQTKTSAVALTLSGKTGVIAYEGKTTEGVKIKVTASCKEVDNL